MSPKRQEPWGCPPVINLCPCARWVRRSQVLNPLKAIQPGLSNFLFDRRLPIGGVYRPVDVLVSGSFETGQLILETDLVCPSPPGIRCSCSRFCMHVNVMPCDVQAHPLTVLFVLNYVDLTTMRNRCSRSNRTAFSRLTSTPRGKSTCCLSCGQCIQCDNND